MRIKIYNYLFLCFALLVCLNFSCTKKLHSSIVNINDDAYFDISSYGNIGNDKEDDARLIQDAFNKYENIYFPKGDFYLKSKTLGFAFLAINENTKVKNIIFENGANLILHPQAEKDYIKPAIIGVYATKSNINSISIKGLTIDGNKSECNLNTVGLLFYETGSYNIKKVYLDSITIKNNGGGGIHTQALFNDFKNIYTENNGSHGIGIINDGNPNQIHEFYLENHLSSNDQSYSIDFSGAYDSNRPIEALKEYKWKGVLKNSKSINSMNGIKTAGYWDLKMEDVIIDGSKYNGFFLSKDAPGTTIEMKNITISNANGNGMYLAGKCNFIGKNISIENCKVLVQIDNTDCDIDGLYLDGKMNNIASLRMGSSDVSIKKFTIKNNQNNDEYAIWAQGGNIVLENGVMENIKGVAPIIVKDTKSIKISNVTFKDFGSRLPNTTYGLMVASTNEPNIQITNCPFITTSSVVNKTKTRISIK